MKTLTLFFLCLLYSLTFSQTGILSGYIFDSRSRDPLEGAAIIITQLENTGTTTDAEGHFFIKLPAGSYSIKVSLIGYLPVLKTDIIIRSGTEFPVTIPLSQTAIGISEVTVTADYFDKSLIENDLSTIVLGAEEVKRSPGSSQDFMRILQAMAGVSFSTDRTNELIVRGGSPDENLTILDNMEIHSINHFPSQYSSGGAVNMINIDLVQDVQFSTGGFISKYGDKLSSIMQITTREGTRTSPFNGSANISMAGIGGILEGRINDGKGSWLISARHSYMDWIKDAVGLTGVPEFYDLQFRLAYDFSAKQKLSFSGIYGNDKIIDNDDPENSDHLLAGKSDSVSLFNEDIKQFQYAAGASLKSIWHNALYSLLTVYYSHYHYNLNETEKFVSRNYNVEGEVFHSDFLNHRTLYDDKLDYGRAAVKAELYWNINKSQELNLGLSSSTDLYIQDIYLSGDSTRYDILKDGWNTPDDIYVFDPASKVNYDISLFNNQKSYIYINDKFTLLDKRLIINTGLRYDYFSFSRKGNVSPRISASYYIVPELTNINIAYGDYYQTQNYPTYSGRYNHDANRYLKNSHARHFILGLEHIPDFGLKLNIEAYYKKYYDLPVSEEFIHYYDRTFRSEKKLNIGTKKICGIDLMLQQKLVKDYYGTLAFSRMWSKNDDIRIGSEGSTYPSEYDYPYVLTLIIGKRFSNLRDRLNAAPFYIKYLTYILPFSNDMEISARWRYAGGRAYTPRIFVNSEQYFEGGMRWTKGSWISADEINSERYDDYHRLDISFSSRYNFQRMSLTVYLSIENIYNRKNITRYSYNPDGTSRAKYQFSIFPVLGLSLTF